MVRGRSLMLPFAAICLVASACGSLGNDQSKESPRPPEPATAIALSILDHAIYLVDPETGARSQVVGDLPDFLAGYAAWAPGHTRLAYGNHGLYVRDYAKGQAALVVPGDKISMPAWSPSGDVLAYGNGASLWITPLFELRPYQIHLPATLAPLAMDWSPEGIAFQGIRRDCARSYLCPTTAESDIWVVQADATDLEQITQIKRALAPKWSPDGESLLFVRRFGGDRRELWAVDADGSHPRQLGTARDVLAADWSPDGSQVVMARRGSEPATIRLWITDSSGEGARALGGPIPGEEATLDW